jgi:hypothetical protein
MYLSRPNIRKISNDDTRPTASDADPSVIHVFAYEWSCSILPLHSGLIEKPGNLQTQPAAALNAFMLKIVFFTGQNWKLLSIDFLPSH